MENHNIKRLFIKYVSLNALGMMGLSCYILADTFFVARGLGTNGLTALNLAIPIYSFINGAGLMAGMGGATRYSISKSNGIFTQSLHLVLILSALFLGAGLFLPNQLASMLGTDATTHLMTATYLRVILCFAPMFMLNNLIICFVRNDGNPKLSMAAMIIGSLSNIVLDYIFIFPLDMGMFGAALATGVSPVISLMILSRHMADKKNTLTLCKQPPSLSSFRDISSLGASSLITELSSGIVIIVFNGIILGLEGNAGVAAYGIIANVALVINAIFTGISQGVQPIVSRYYGMDDRHSVKQIVQYGMVTSIVFAVLVYIASFVFARPIVGIFNKAQDGQLAAIATQGLRIYFTAFVFVGVNVLRSTCLSAVDKPRVSLILSLLRGLVLIIPMTLLLSSTLGMVGVWLSLPLTEAIVLVSYNFISKRYGLFQI